MTLKPEDFPRGFAESSQPGLFELKEQLAAKREPFYQVRTRPEFQPLLFDLAYGKYMDAGLAYYGEFFTNLEYGWDLLHRGSVTLDGVPGSVQVVARFTNGVQLKWTPSEGDRYGF